MAFGSFGNVSTDGGVPSVTSALATARPAAWPCGEYSRPPAPECGKANALGNGTRAE